MKIQLMSDLHSEFYKHLKFKKFVEALEPEDVDVLILAGDIGDFAHFPNAIRWICERYKNVVGVLGNHEFWRSSPEETLKTARNLSKELGNYHFLNNDVVEIEGQRFLGGTMWFPDSPNARLIGYRWPDFAHIQGGNPWIYQENERAQAFLNQEMKEGDVVITHHLPSEKCVAPQYKGDKTNCYFVCPMDKLIEERKPKLWCAGHTHSSIDMDLYDTRIVCNPFGYHGYEENEKFINSMNIEV